MHRSFDGLRRRRILLARHGEVNYLDASGAAIADPRQVPLTPAGEEQARRLGDALAGHALDLRLSSPLKRSYDTMRLATGDPDAAPAVEVVPDLEEVRLPPRDRLLRGVTLEEIAYPFQKAGGAGAYSAAFWGGERIRDFRQRVLGALNAALARDGWNTALIVAHGGVNAVILCWALEAPLELAAHLDQEYCCLNVIDVDLGEDGRVARKLLRAMNATALRDGSLGMPTQWEALARGLQLRAAGSAAE